MRVLLLGGTGFIGRATQRTLVALGHDVVTASRATSADVTVDATDAAALAAVLAGDYDAVVNLLGAGLARGTSDHDTMHAVNAAVPATILRTLAQRSTPPHLVHAASSTERRRPHHRHESDYSESKHDGALALRSAIADAGVPLTMLTVHNTYGPDQPEARFVRATIDSLRGGRAVRLEHPERTRDFVFVDDVAHSIAHAVASRENGLSEADIGTGTGLTLKGAAHTIARALGRSEDLVEWSELAEREDDPNPYTVAAVRFGTYGCCTTTFEDGLARTLEEAS